MGCAGGKEKTQVAASPVASPDAPAPATNGDKPSEPELQSIAPSLNASTGGGGYGSKPGVKRSVPKGPRLDSGRLEKMPINTGEDFQAGSLTTVTEQKDRLLSGRTLQLPKSSFSKPLKSKLPPLGTGMAEGGMAEGEEDENV